jgi:mannose-6-phosphate isomerase-like protein (cupin superfamily)
MDPAIHHPDPTTEFKIPEGCFILEAWNHPSDPGVSIARARLAPAVTTQPHRLCGVVERYLIIEGTGIVRIGELPEERVGRGDVVVIPAGVSQSISNTGESDLIFYCICSPRFTPGCYEALT